MSYTEIIAKHKRPLGRDKDPRVISDINRISLCIRKIAWILLTAPSLRIMTKLIYPKSTISHFNRDGAVAFTIDDGFCGVDNPEGCMLKDVLRLLKSSNAHATFFITGSHCDHTSRGDVDTLLANGHELANHSMMDWPYTSYSEEEFALDIDTTENILSQYRKTATLWYRAPFGRINKLMQKVLNERKMHHVVCDAFANDTAIPDAHWISKYILKRVKPGSVILIHMPEKGVREWNLEAMRLTLEGLLKNNLKVVNLTELQNRLYASTWASHEH